MWDTVLGEPTEREFLMTSHPIKRRTFLTISAATIACAATPGFAKLLSKTEVDLWPAKVDTVLNMAYSYDFSLQETAKMLNMHPQLADSRSRLREDTLMCVRSFTDLAESIDNILTIHTWIRGGVGTTVSLQLQELDRLRTIAHHPVAAKRPGQSLGGLMRDGDYSDIQLAADFCQKTPFVV